MGLMIILMMKMLFGNNFKRFYYIFSHEFLQKMVQLGSCSLENLIIFFNIVHKGSHKGSVSTAFPHSDQASQTLNQVSQASNQPSQASNQLSQVSQPSSTSNQPPQTSNEPAQASNQPFQASNQPSQFSQALNWP